MQPISRKRRIHTHRGGRVRFHLDARLDALNKCWSYLLVSRTRSLLTSALLTALCEINQISSAADKLPFLSRQRNLWPRALKVPRSTLLMAGLCLMRGSRAPARTLYSTTVSMEDENTIGRPLILLAALMQNQNA